MAAAHGGQIVISGATESLVRDQLPAVRVVDLGEHRLRDLGRPMRVFQLTWTDHHISGFSMAAKRSMRELLAPLEPGRAARPSRAAGPAAATSSGSRCGRSW